MREALEIRHDTTPCPPYASVVVLLFQTYAMLISLFPRVFTATTVPQAIEESRERHAAAYIALMPRHLLHEVLSASGSLHEDAALMLIICAHVYILIACQTSHRRLFSAYSPA